MASIRISWSILATSAVLLALAFWGAWGLWQEAEAHNIGWKWNTNSTPMATNYNTFYTSPIASAATDYDSNTDLAVHWCISPCNESIEHRQQFVGNVDWTGAADSYSNGSQCYVDITCDEVSNQVTYGHVIWNSAYGPYTDSYANYLARHEMGHIFGLAHASCHAGGDYGGGSYYSVMAVLCPYGPVDELQDHDIDDINDKY